MARRPQLTDKQVENLKPAAEGARYEKPDSEPGLSVRVTDKGTKTFILYTRYPNSPAPSRRALGEYGELSLADAREKARDWKKLIARGIDPRIEEDRQRAAEQRRRKATFAAVAEDFIADKLSKERKGAEVERDIRRDLIPPLGSQPITDISDDELAALVKAKARKAPSQARNLLGTVKRFFQWAIDQREYGIRTSPAAGLKPAALCGEKIARDRVLSEDETFAFWRAVKRLPYPFGPIYRLLALNGLRLNEVADAQWSEFDPAVVRVLRDRKNDATIDWTKIPADRLIWTIPGARMKGKDSRARPHVVPLTSETLALLQTIPMFKRGDFIFSTTFGERPVWVSDKIKKKLDARMVRTLRALARQRGDDPATVKLEPWKNHDLRRVVRSGLSRERIAEEVREAVLAHVRPGIKGTYDVHKYLDEKREALMLWAARLRSIVEPPPANVARFPIRERA